MAAMTTAAPPRLVLAGNDPPRVAFVADTKDGGPAPERGVGYVFFNVEGERSHVGMLPSQSATVIIVDSLDALDLLRYVLAWPGPGGGGGQ